MCSPSCTGVLKGWFPYDRGSQIADRNKVCDRLRSSAIIWKLLLRSSAILRSRSQTIAEDRTMFYLKAGFHMIADDRRPYCDLRSAICDLRSAIIWKPALSDPSHRLKYHLFTFKRALFVVVQSHNVTWCQKAV